MNDEKFAALVQDYKMTFGTPEGKRVLADLEKNVCRVNDTTFVIEPYENAMRQGQRFVYLLIKRKIDTDLSKQEVIDAISQEKP